MSDEATVAGLPIMNLPECTPLAALVLIKALDDEGNPTYYARGTDDLTTVEALGMAYACIERLKEAAAEDMS